MLPETPLLTVDALIIYSDNRIVLIKRKNPPYGWTLPGGFVDIGETVETAVKRETKEETGINFRKIRLLGVYSDPARDPRGHSVSVAFYGVPEDENQIPSGGDDAKDAKLFFIDELPEEIVFDHRKIISDYIGKADEWI